MGDEVEMAAPHRLTQHLPLGPSPIGERLPYLNQDSSGLLGKIGFKQGRRERVFHVA